MGEATVVSRNLHITEAQRPQAITILTDRDFGQEAYGRFRQGDVIHIDVFHAVAEVDHHRVAAALRGVLAGVPAPRIEGPGTSLMDYFDLGTATGSGRITSGMDRARKLAPKVAHRNHVHVAGLLPYDHLPLLPQIVAAVEEAILAQGVELRRIERLLHRQGGKGSSVHSDLSRYYADDLDSYIKGGRPPGGGERAADGQSLRSGRGFQGNGQTRDGDGLDGGGRGRREGGPGEVTPGHSASGQASSGRDGVGHAGPGQAGPGLSGSGLSGSGQVGLGQSGSGAGSLGADDAGESRLASGRESLESEQRLQTALDLSRRLGSPDEVKRLLEELAREQGWAYLYQGGGSQAPFVLRQLEEAGLVRKEIRGMRLTPEGKELLAYMQRHMREVTLRFRKLIRRIPGTDAHKRGRKNLPGRGTPSPDVRYGLIRGTAPAQAGAWLGDLAVPETIGSAIRRTHLSRIAQGGHSTASSTALRPIAADSARLLRLERGDIHVHLRAAEHALHVCLLIDASASMAGRRILAAKHLARHLLLSTKDKIAAIAFQEREVKVYVPFTRDYGLVEEGLARIQPMGLTPLAHGLTQSMELIRGSRVRRPLLLLITDGIPTVPKWTIDPLADALEAARYVRQGRVPFGCIGLQPSRRYLEQLTREAGGTLHVVDELSEESLVSIAHEERQKLSPQVR